MQSSALEAPHRRVTSSLHAAFAQAWQSPSWVVSGSTRPFGSSSSLPQAKRIKEAMAM